MRKHGRQDAIDIYNTQSTGHDKFKKKGIKEEQKSEGTHYVLTDSLRWILYSANYSVQLKMLEFEKKVFIWDMMYETIIPVLNNVRQTSVCNTTKCLSKILKDRNYVITYGEIYVRFGGQIIMTRLMMTKYTIPVPRNTALFILQCISKMIIE